MRKSTKPDLTLMPDLTYNMCTEKVFLDILVKMSQNSQNNIRGGFSK